MSEELVSSAVAAAARTWRTFDDPELAFASVETQDVVSAYLAVHPRLLAMLGAYTAALRDAGWVGPEGATNLRAEINKLDHEVAAHEGEIGDTRSQLSAAEAERDALLSVVEAARAAVALLEIGECYSDDCPGAGAGQPIGEATCPECAALGTLLTALDQKAPVQ